MIYKFSVIYLFTIILYQLTYSPKPLKVFRSFLKNVSVLCNNVRSSTLPDISFIYLSHFIETHTQIAAVASATLPKQLNRRKTFISSNEYIKFCNLIRLKI